MTQSVRFIRRQNVLEKIFVHVWRINIFFLKKTWYQNLADNITNK